MSNACSLSHAEGGSNSDSLSAGWGPVDCGSYVSKDTPEVLKDSKHQTPLTIEVYQDTPHTTITAFQLTFVLRDPPTSSGWKGKLH